MATAEVPARNPSVPTGDFVAQQADVGAVNAMMAAQPRMPLPATLYVGDLDVDATEADLYEKFSKFGTIMSIHVCRDSVTRQSLGYAYVNFQNKTDAQGAMQDLNYEPLSDKAGSRPLRIMWSERDPSKRRNPAGNIFIKNLNKDITNKQLYDTCSQIGPIKSVRIPVDQEGHSKGYGYVQFENEKHAEDAIAKLNGRTIEGNKVTVAAYIPRSERVKSTELMFTNVFVKNVPLDWDQAKFVEVCAKFGTVTSPFFPTTEDGKGRGFAFANFATPEMAKAAVEGLPEVDVGENDKLWAGRALKKSELLRVRYN
jgi:polyadenylate-binding protein